MLTENNTEELLDTIFGKMDKSDYHKLLETATGIPTETKKTNPFLDKLVIETNKRVGGIIAVEKLTDENGEEVGTELRARKYVDNATFIKVMSASFGILFNMKASGQKMFWLVMQKLQESSISKDIVQISFNDYDAKKKLSKETQLFSCSHGTFYGGLRELKKHNFIAEFGSRSGFYWINPLYFFNGDRIRFVQEWVKQNPSADARPRVSFPAGIEESKPDILRKK